MIGVDATVNAKFMANVKNKNVIKFLGPFFRPEHNMS